MKSQRGFAPLLIILTVLVVIAIAGGAYYFGFDHGFEKSAKPLPASVVSSPIPQTTRAPSLTSVPNDETANWKTYMHNLGHSFKYPSDWGVIYESDTQVNIGPENLRGSPGYDGVISLNRYDKSQTTTEAIIADVGEQFADGDPGEARIEKREKVAFGGVLTTKLTVTTPSDPDWVSISYIFDLIENIYVINNGATLLYQDTFEKVAHTFQMVP